VWRSIAGPRSARATVLIVFVDVAVRLAGRSAGAVQAHLTCAAHGGRAADYVCASHALPRSTVEHYARRRRREIRASREHLAVDIRMLVDFVETDPTSLLHNGI